MIAGVLLAAGRSERMGQPKQLLGWHGTPLVRHTALIALESQLDELVVVVGHAAERVQAVLADLPLRIVVNEAFAAGQSTSLAIGISALAPHVNGAVVLLADHPLLQPATVNTLLETYAQTAALMVVPRFRGQRGNPVLFARSMFAELQAVQGDQGARALFTRYAQQVQWVDVADEGTLLDVDTPVMYQELLDRQGASQK